MGLAAIRSALATAGVSGTDLKPYGFVSLKPELPALVAAWPEDFPAHQIEASPATTYTIPLHILVGLRQDRTADSKMMGYLDTVAANVEANPTLSSTVACVTAVTFQRVVAQEISGGVAVLIGTLLVEVMT